MVKYGYILLIMAAVLLLSACGRSQKGYDRVISDAERVVESHGADSAMAMLEQIDPADMKHDSLRAKYVYVTALAHVRQNRSMVGDSLIGMAHEYYRSHGDLQRSMRCALLTAWYRFWTDDTPGAIAMLDSLTRLEGVADSLIVECCSGRRNIRVRIISLLRKGLSKSKPTHYGAWKRSIVWYRPMSMPVAWTRRL